MVKPSPINISCECCTDKSCATQALPEPELKLLASGCSKINLSKGDVILTEGTVTSHILYLKSGIAKEYQQIENDNEYILQIVKGPTYLGLQSLSGDTANQFSYTALSDATVCYIERDVFKSLLLNNSKFSYIILETVCRDSLSHYHRFVNHRQKHIHGKLADALLYFSKHIFESDEFVLPLNRSEISFLIGTSRESISKQLRIYEREGLLKIAGKKIHITNFEQLEKISRFG